MNPDALIDLLTAQNVLALQRVEPGLYARVGKLPAWLSPLLPGETALSDRFHPEKPFPFLETFLEDIEAALAESDPSVDRLQSGWWTEVTPDNHCLELEASAHLLPSGCFLLIRHLEEEYQERFQLLQKARETSLNLEKMMAEASKKEILLHCIIHDLSGPLSGMQGCLEMLAQDSLSDQGKRFLELGRLEAGKQANLIKDLLDVFAMEVRELEDPALDPSQAPEVSACITSVIQGMSSAFALRKVRAVFEPPAHQPLRVRGETSRLERILYNLLQNALRHTPKESTVTVRVLEQSDQVEIHVEDEGSGVPEQLQGQLFQKFVKGRDPKAGKVGLGLFFCRITLERWGGSIGYQPGRGGGSCFRIQLQKPPENRD